MGGITVEPREIEEVILVGEIGGHEVILAGTKGGDGMWEAAKGLVQVLANSNGIQPGQALFIDQETARVRVALRVERQEEA